MATFDSADFEGTNSSAAFFVLSTAGSGEDILARFGFGVTGELSTLCVLGGGGVDSLSDIIFVRTEERQRIDRHADAA